MGKNVQFLGLLGVAILLILYKPQCTSLESSVLIDSDFNDTFRQFQNKIK